MSRFVIDASVVLTWCFPDENALLARKVALMFKQGDTPSHRASGHMKF